MGRDIRESGLSAPSVFGWRLTHLAVAVVASSFSTALHGAVVGTSVDEAGDRRIRVVAYAADEVYRLKGYVGFQIDLEFEDGESFVGLGAGDLESITFASQGNHLFLKPHTAGVDTNITVLTSRRTYHFDYSVSERRPESMAGDVVYVLRFAYPRSAAEHAVDAVERQLANAAGSRWHNLRYSYRGSPGLKPISAWDDGVETRLRFASQQELPAIFVGNDDGTESLLNFHIDNGEVVAQRVARHFIVRRGRLQGCILNEGFTGSGERLQSGTVAPSVERVTKGAPR